MENRSNRKSEEVASTKTDFRNFRSSARVSRVTADSSSPQISVSLDKEVFVPSDFLACEYSVTIRGKQAVQAIESSVLWITEGKGEEDIGVHFFERRKKQAINTETFKSPQRISTVLPSSPLSYEGKILTVRWCVRIRLFMEGGEQITEDKYFKLGKVEAFPNDTDNQTDDQTEGS